MFAECRVTTDHSAGSMNRARFWSGQTVWPSKFMGPHHSEKQFYVALNDFFTAPLSIDTRQSKTMKG